MFTGVILILLFISDFAVTVNFASFSKSISNHLRFLKLSQNVCTYSTKYMRQREHLNIQRARVLRSKLI